MKTIEKLAELRKIMLAKSIDAFVVYSADPHMSEYLPTEWQERSWLSGFTGSAGFVVVTKDKAGLWTDGRYFVQANKELEGSTIELMKMGVEGTPDYIDWIIANIPANGKVAVNALATAHANWELLKNQLSAKGLSLVNQPLLKDIWINRVEVVEKNLVFVQPVERAGKSVADKLADIRKEMKKQEVTAHVIGSLDDVAWTLNLRGSDVECNPVFLGYILLKLDRVVLFVDLEKLNDEAKASMKKEGVELKPYEAFFSELETLKNETFLISATTNQSVFDTLEKNNKIKVGAVPGNLMKAQKNEVELEGFRIAMERDGVALVKFFHWLTHNVGKEKMDEYSIGEKLEAFRAEGDNFVGISFGSIIGYKGNGAIVHYSAKKDDCKEVTNDGSILIDSGGQYLEGTTDITRTLALGKVSDEFKRDTTLVLKGMIQLTMAKFPKGTKGVHLDAIARLPLWKESKDYAHGTGHGVGSFMNVHEGPQNIRKDMNNQDLMVGMVCSDEPGYYLEDKYGIRHENLVAVKEIETTGSGTFYGFETLTICPFFNDTFVIEMLSEEERKWLNDYHQFCKDKLEKHLEG
ncbi:MAG: Xaa-Pro aminopeptidase, partial [Flavobacteriales bacterium]